MSLVNDNSKTTVLFLRILALKALRGQQRIGLSNQTALKNEADDLTWAEKHQTTKKHARLCQCAGEEIRWKFLLVFNCIDSAFPQTGA